MHERIGPGLLEVPEESNGRGLREVGCLPGAGPGYAEAPAGGGLEQIRQGLLDGELDALVLVHADPIRNLPDGPGWAEALRRARNVIAVSAFDDASTGAADIVIPAEAYAEKEGTVTHPDGRLQRLRPAVPRPGDVHPIWQVLAELSSRLGDETGIDSGPEALEALAAEVPFYAGITPEEIGGRGVRWQERAGVGAGPGNAPADPSRGADAASGDQQPAAGRRASADPSPDPASGDGLRLGTYRDLWADEVTDRNVALRFLAPAQTVELAPSDGERLGLADGDEVEVRSNGTAVRARVELRERMRPGTAFLVEATATDNANALQPGETVEVIKP
ncbi:MAG: molybdopterin oxidoreductase family protein, partial [Solirubrobacterales bacterium]